MTGRDSPAVVWIGPRAADAAMLGGHFRSAAIFSADSDQDRTTWSLESHTGVRRRWGAASVAEVVAMFAAQIRHAAVEADAVLPYAMDSALPALAADRALLGPSPELWNRLDDKRTAVRVFDAARVPHLDYREMPASHLPRLAVPGHSERELVVQVPRASGGMGTHFVRANARDLALVATRLSGSVVLVTDFEVGSYSLNAHVAVLPGGVLIGPLSVQLVGIRHCTSRSAGYCGNDFAAMSDVDPGVVGRALEIVNSVGWALSDLGFRGVAGLDLLVTSRLGVFPIDLNPRFQASTRALAQAEDASCVGPGFVDLAIGSQLGMYGSDDVRNYVVPRTLPMIQLIFYHRSPFRRFRRAGEYGTTAAVGEWSLTGLAPAGVGVEPGAVLATATRSAPGHVSPESAAERLVSWIEGFYGFAQ